MPNWCLNNVEVKHADPQMIARAKSAFERGEFLNEFIPIPTELKDVNAPNRDESAEILIEKYGYSDWYSFCVNEWGTKWDIGGPGQLTEHVVDTSFSISFDSAWSPPTAAYERLVNEFGFEIRATYFEPGMAFCGIWEDGGDDFYDYSGLSSEEILATLPQELDEGYNISSDVAEWEADNQEDEENLEIELDDGVSSEDDPK